LVSASTATPRNRIHEATPLIPTISAGIFSFSIRALQKYRSEVYMKSCFTIKTMEQEEGVRDIKELEKNV
jgi:hypothetical protein